MIASLQGEVLEIGPDAAVIDCGGVGYQFLATPRTLGGLRRGKSQRVLTHLAVKEDALTLYGFSAAEERRMFLLLQTVSGLGPKLALATLGTLGPAEIASTVTTADTKTLQTVPGVGKRMADRLIVELKEKVADYLPVSPHPAPPTGATTGVAAQVAGQVTEALIGLGFTERVAVPVVDGVLAASPDLDTAAALRASLTELGRA